MKIAVLPGDGIGPEIMAEAIKVMNKVEQVFGVHFETEEAAFGGAAIDLYGTPLPDHTLSLCQEADAVLLGSIGGAQWDSLPPEKRPETGGLLALRKKLNLYANLRPVRLYPNLREFCPVKVKECGVDILVVRELGGGIYFGTPRVYDDNHGLDTMVYTCEEVQRIAKIGFEAAMDRDKRVCSIDKSNVLASSRLWRREVEKMGAKYPEVELTHMYVDNAAMQLILNPHQFDVILAGNLFGDILSDEAAVLAGSLGLLPSASFGSSVKLYEPAGGSAPDIAGKGIANPVAQILSLAMMLEYSFDMPEAANCVRNAIEETIRQGIVTSDLTKGKGASTSEMGTAIVNNI